LVKFDTSTKASHSQQLIASQTFFQGPLPSPEILEKYNKLHPGAVERIFVMAETQTKHRQEIEIKTLDRDFILQTRGQIFGFVTCLVTLLGGITLLALSKSIVGMATLVSSLGILIGSNIYTRQTQNRSLSKP